MLENIGNAITRLPLF